ncbi:MAG TPA: hypothetical protein VMW27_20030 [Thermoanaerobaculia bacterium]|nr:hypothetical protein [Thermoanaerobaculia bacterium]
MKTKLRLLSLAVLLTLAALPKPAAAARCIPDYCWIVSADVTCCYEFNCSIVCG